MLLLSIFQVYGLSLPLSKNKRIRNDKDGVGFHYHRQSLDAVVNEYPIRSLLLIRETEFWRGKRKPRDPGWIDGGLVQRNDGADDNLVNLTRA